MNDLVTINDGYHKDHYDDFTDSGSSIAFINTYTSQKLSWKYLRSYLSITSSDSSSESSLESAASSINWGVRRLYYSIVGEDLYLDDKKFHEFWTGVQNETESLNVFEKYSKNGLMSILEFHALLNSKDNLGYVKEVNYDRPINEFFISSSHNTYLTGRQVGGVSSVDWYIYSLKNGCRCVEIDIWNGDNGPVVSHGLTLTSSVSLVKVVNVIKKYAFTTTDLPLILSIEIHCRKSYQLLVRRILMEGFGDSLLTTKLDESNKLPTVNQLRNRILIKIKRKSRMDINSESDSSEDDNFKIIPELCDMSYYIYGIKFRKFLHQDSKAFNHCYSFSNRKLNLMMKNHSEPILNHNLNHLMRVYPAGYKITSRNFNPINFWKYGCQLVATNWQTYDLGEQINQSMFEYGNSGGYILKPAYLRHRNTMGKLPTNPLNNVSNIYFSIHILSTELFSHIQNPIISMKVIGEENEMRLEKSNGSNIHFNGVITNTLSEFIFVKLSVYNDNYDNDYKSMVTLRLCSMKKGYRYLQLYDAKGLALANNKLFVKIDYNESR